MISSNKILTVSYGTFSCTLEGFEDSFGTMKAIAEYFRDLAADDRYFGAEPPKPDAEMLARIAEKEIERRVEARASAAGIHLRADDAAPALAAEPAVEAPSAQTALEAGEQDPHKEYPGVPTPPVEDVARDAEVDNSITNVLNSVADESADGVDDQPMDEPVQDQVLSEDEPQSESAPEPMPTMQASMGTSIFANSVTDDFQDASLEQDAPIAHAGAFDAAEAEDIVLAEDDTEVAALDEDDVEASELAEDDTETAPLAEDQAEGVEPTDDVAEVVAEDVVEETPQLEPTSIAAKLQRIRAVVAKTQNDESNEDEDATDYTDGDPDLVEDFFNSSADDQFEPVFEPATQPVPTPPTDDEVDELSALLANIQDETDEILEAEAQLDEQSDILDLGSFDAEPELDAYADTLTEEDISNLLAPSDHEDGDDFEEIASVVSELYLEDDLEAEEDATQLEDVAQEVTAPRAQLIKVKRSDMEAAIENGLLSEEFDEIEDAEAEIETDDANLEQDTLETSLSDDDEADLLRELAAVEAELGDADEYEDEVDPDTRAADATAARLLEEVAGADEDELDRLMSEADQQMEEPEAESRRSAFQHLRGAVEATKADDKLSDAAKIADEDEYRTDLAAAVRPRRPVAGVGGKDRPRNERPAPLKLVAEQRIDTSEAKSGPVRPRRVASEAQSDDDGSFADYASARGARELPELLEAAASYLSFVEGRDQFSRPQLMTKVRQLQLDGFTREDGLRHFGKLLRAGKIEKIKGGRFTVSEDIGFQPDDERAVG